MYNFRSDDVLSVSAVGDSMRLLGVYGLDERVTSAMVVGRGPQPSFLVKRSSDGKELRYPGTLTLTVSAGKLSLVNTIDMDTYVSRVVQSEVGNGAHPEYYKIQGIICRTYAVGNRGRHAAQGFDLCDHQHCQVYGAMGDPSESVVKATAATSGIVMADTSARPILATFHANCGGQTANAKDVWAEARSYLISVTDTFCTSQRSAVWTEQVPVEKFRQQFTDADTILVDGFKLQTEHRQSHLTIGKETVRTADLRRDLRLRSAFFDLAVAGDAVLLSGRGFGHGVGLCQQGAMQMAQLGHSYSEILGHYYTNVALVNISSLR
ncbi:MAG: SpoIID/LytB domain-containing protein [Flavobacteriales bacterium]|nr:SpoIID/LytB domain-containing protein [Flavobacteriales bacterium]